MFEHAFRFGMRYGPRVLFGMAAAILGLGVLVSVGRFIQTTAEMPVNRATPLAEWLFLVMALFSAVKEAVVPVVAAIVLERFDRWMRQSQPPVMIPKFAGRTSESESH
jgi:hypothetical protein